MKNNNELIPIESREGVTTYGRIVGPGGKLGQYTVHSDVLGDDGNVYHLYSQAQRRMAALIGFQKDYEKGK